MTPIAIVGQACVLPGALDPATLADNLFAGRDAVRPVPDGRWDVRMDDVLGDGPDRTWSTAGGYVQGFERVWDPSGFLVPAEELVGLDPLFLWLLHTGRAALRDAHLDVGARSLARAGAVFGNLSFPTDGMARWGEHVVLRRNGLPAPAADPRDRFMSGLPADLLARALGLGRHSFALDAACASSLYAIKLACDALNSRRADVMLAGAVQRADSLFLHVGFCALGAMSRRGQSRPFHVGADGLVPAEGAALLTLVRLEDAIRDGRRILGVIRGVGLSNDGRARNLLAPSSEGQARALRLAYAAAGLSPADIQLAECHATGTPTGDRTEIATLASVFGGHPLHVGSFKSMLGHLITAAGVAGMLKVIAGFARQTMPPTLHAEDPIPAVAEAGFQLLHEPRPWDAPVRRACVSAFGFGGNNAHLVLEEFVPGGFGGRGGPPATPPAAAVDPDAEPPGPARFRPLAVVGIAVAAGADDDRAAFARDLFAGTGSDRRQGVTLPLTGLRFPPNDLRLSLAQQTLLLRIVPDALAGLVAPRERTAIVVGMGADVEVCGWGLRWRIGGRTGARGDALRGLQDAAIDSLKAEHVVGTMPNIPANRLNVQLDVGGPGFTVSAEELSGLAALAVAADALHGGEADLAVAAAVDLGGDPRHVEAGGAAGDAAIALVLERLEDAQRHGHRVWATIDAVDVRGAGADSNGGDQSGLKRDAISVRAPTAFGRPHAAVALLDVAAAVLSVAHGRKPGGEAWSGERRAVVRGSSLGGARAEVEIGGVGAPFAVEALPALAGPVLTLPAHRAEIVLPGGDPRSSAPTASSASTGSSASGLPVTPRGMAPAPGLPPVGSAASAALVLLPTGSTPADWKPVPATSAPASSRSGSSTAPTSPRPAPTPTAPLAPAAGAPAVSGLPRVAEASPAGGSSSASPVGTAGHVSTPSPLATPRGVSPAVTANNPGIAAPPAAISAPSPADGRRRVGRLPPRPPRPPRSSSEARMSRAPLSPGIDPVAAAFLESQARLAEVHRAFVEQQAEAQARFAATRTATTRMFVQAATGGGEPRVDQVLVPLSAPRFPGGADLFVSQPPAAAESRPTEAFGGASGFAPTPPPAGFGVSAAVAPATPPTFAAPPVAAAPTSAAPIGGSPALTPPASSPASSASTLAPSPTSTALSGRALSPTVPTFTAPLGASARTTSAPAAPASFPGPKLSREDLVDIASGPVSKFFGPMFEPQDQYARVVRMPMPPLLLADRVLGIEGPPCKLGKGSIWTETDVTADAWYLHEGRMPGGILIESGQADLLLASWQGIDISNNKGERMYRLLGCDLRYEGDLPEVGDTLRYDIHIDGHARLGDIRMFFFHYDCRIGPNVRLSVREGQAGFFSKAELDASGGILWDPQTAEMDLSGPWVPPAADCSKDHFAREDLVAFTEGRVRDCFGPGFYLADTHTHTPRIAGGRMLFFDRVTRFDPVGGPWKRGYLCAETDITPQSWFFDGHFFNDPCMPGTLMFEGCLQALQLYLTALGHTLSRDGWRFRPRAGETFKLRCRGQVIPTSRLLTYELFVVEVGLDPLPYVKAQVLCTVDGLKCFHADPLTVEMVPDWPLSRRKELVDGYVEPKPCEWGYPSLLACAWGRPTHAFGPAYAPFDSTRRVARLPGPPYHFLSRILTTSQPMGAMKAGVVIDVEYDVPPDAWYFNENGAPTMPFAVLLEAALQPCGWLASYVGSALTTTEDLLFRNLDGTGTLHREIPRDGGSLRTTVKITGINRSAGMIIESFEVAMSMGGKPLYDMKTVFGFFPVEAFANQVGVGSEPADRAWLAEANDFLVDLTARPPAYCAGALRLPEPMLLMIDRVTGFWPTGGKAGLGKWRADKDVDPAEWFFKAHFFQDPVQPGSLGIEAMIQLAQFVMLHRGMGKGMKNPHFEALASGEELKWKYRGQVVPKNKLIQTELEITKVTDDTLWCEAHLWVDGKRIYSAWNLGMRVVDGPVPPLGAGGAPPPPQRPPLPSAPSGEGSGSRGSVSSAGAVGAGVPSGGARGVGPGAAVEPHRRAEPAGVAGAGARQPSGSVPSSAGGAHRPSGSAPVGAGGVVGAGARPPSGSTRALGSAGDAVDSAHRPSGSAQVGAGGVGGAGPASGSTLGGAAPVGAAVGAGARRQELRLAVPVDHCPTYVLPALPAMTMVMLALSATGASGLKEATVTRWLTFPDGPRAVTATVDGDRVVLAAPEPFFVATAAAPEPPIDLPPLRDPVPGPDGASLYASGELFHGPAFHVVERVLARGKNGATLLLRPAAPDVLLDGITHGIPHDHLEDWCPEIAPGQVGYPSRIESLSLYGAPPNRPVRAEIRFLGLVAGRPLIAANLYDGDTVLASIAFQEVLLPKGRIGNAPAHLRRDFLKGAAGTGVTLSRIEGETAVLSPAEVRASDWLPGTVERVFGSTDPTTIAAKELAAARLGAHPRDVVVDGSRAWLAHHPLSGIGIAPVKGGVSAIPEAPLAPVIGWWRARGNPAPWPGEELIARIAAAWLRDLVVHDPAGLAALRGRPVLYLGNHQNYLESVLFTTIVSWLGDMPVRALAKVEHRDQWLGRLERLLTTWPGHEQPPRIVWFDQQDPGSLPALVRGALDQSLLVHVEGSRQVRAGQPIDKISSLWVDVALEARVPIVPVAFRGGLAGGAKHDVPPGPQVHHLGAPILPEALTGVPYPERRRRIAEAIDSLGTPEVEGTGAAAEPVEALRRVFGGVEGGRW